MVLLKTIPKETITRAKVLVVGDAMLDRYWYGAVDRISPEAPVPVVRVTREEDRIGAAANVAYNVVTMGAQASLLTVVGNDEASHKLQELVAQTGITPHSFDAVIVSDYAKGGLAHVVDMIALARAAGKPVLIDPKGSDYSRYAGATVITPNKSELQVAIGGWKDEAELHVKAENLRTQLKLDAVLLTRSDEGMSLFDDQGAQHVSTQALEVFDVTGAGDTVIATLATLVAAGMSLRQAMPYANKAGGIVVGKFGTATASYEELFA